MHIVVLLFILILQICCNVLGYNKEYRYYRWSISVFLIVLCIAVLPIYFTEHGVGKFNGEKGHRGYSEEDIWVLITFYIFGTSGILLTNLLFSLWKYANKRKKSL
jgi:hypothetical protein